MNDDALFLIVFFCTAAASGLASSMDEQPMRAAGAIRICDCGHHLATAIPSESSTPLDRLTDRRHGAIAPCTPHPASSEISAATARPL